MVSHLEHRPLRWGSGIRSVAWGSSFVVGGAYDGKPAIWISASQQ